MPYLSMKITCESTIQGFGFCQIFSFWPRHNVLTRRGNHILFRFFDSYASDPEDILLCPCRALRIYLDRTRSLRGNVDNLFLTYQKGLCKAAAKSSLSRWIVSLIRYVYEDLPHGPLFNVRAHDTRRLSASWALFNGASIQDILQAAHWAAETTFTSFYLKDVVWNEDRFARASVLETAQWARRSRSCHQNRQ